MPTSVQFYESTDTNKTITDTVYNVENVELVDSFQSIDKPSDTIVDTYKFDHYDVEAIDLIKEPDTITNDNFNNIEPEKLTYTTPIQNDTIFLLEEKKIVKIDTILTDSNIVKIDTIPTNNNIVKPNKTDTITTYHNVIKSYKTDTITTYQNVIIEKSIPSNVDNMEILTESYLELLTTLDSIKLILNQITANNKKTEVVLVTNNIDTISQDTSLTKSYEDPYYENKRINDSIYTELIKSKTDSINLLQNIVLELAKSNQFYRETIINKQTKRASDTLVVEPLIENDSINLTKKIPQRVSEDTLKFETITSTKSSSDLYETNKIIGYYLPNSSIPNNISEIRSLFTKLNREDIILVYTSCHTDISGNKEINLDLSKKRSDAFEKLLKKEFHLSSEQIYKEYFGSKFASKVKNEKERRIEITIISKAKL